MSAMPIEPPIQPLTGEVLSRVLDEIEGLAPPLCEAAWPGAFRDWLPMCDRPATAMHRYACIHEHVRHRATCTDHAPQPGIVGCRQCFDEGHECPMTAEPVDWTLT